MGSADRIRNRGRNGLIRSTLLCGATAWPLTARAQQPAMPAIGFLGTSTASSPPAIGFHRGLGEAGFVEGRNTQQSVAASGLFCISFSR
jgi:hypothetical protein